MSNQVCGECGCLGPMAKAGKQIKALEAEVARLQAALDAIHATVDAARFPAPRSTSAKNDD